MTFDKAYKYTHGRYPLRISAMSVFALLLSLITACGDGERSGFCSTGDGWLYADTLTFDIADSGEPDADMLKGTTDPKTGKVTIDSTRSRIERGDIAVVIRHTNAYPYSNVWLQIDYTDADSVRRDTVNIPLADRFGNWYGNGMGLSYQARTTVIANAVVDLTKPLQIRHIMRCDTLQDIEQVGVVFIPAEKARKERAAKSGKRRKGSRRS